MNVNRSSLVTQKSNPANRSTQRSTSNVYQSRSDQQHFQKLLNDLKEPESQSDRPNDKEELTSLTAESALEDIDSILHGDTGEDLSAFVDDDEMASSSSSSDSQEGNTNEQSNVDYTGAGIEMSAMPVTGFESTMDQHGANAGGDEKGSIGSLPLNEAAAKIIEQMQSQARRREARRWQFSLPGLLGSSVEVTIECSEDQSWNVELSTAEHCSDEDRLALQHRLAERMDDVSVVLVSA